MEQHLLKQVFQFFKFAQIERKHTSEVEDKLPIERKQQSTSHSKVVPDQQDK